MPNRTISPRELEVELTSRLAAIESRRGSRPRRRSNGHARAKFVGVAAVVSLMLMSVGVVFADGGSLDVQIANKTLYKVDTTDDGAIVEYIGDSNVTFGASGSGIFESFLQTQDDPSEEGYNTDGAEEFDTGHSPTFNHAILVSEIPVVACESLDGNETHAGLCWELFADINDSNARDPQAKQIQLTDLEIWFTDDSEITGYLQNGTGFGTAADKTYDFSGTILINDVNQGSGRGDLRYLIPINDLTVPIPGECDYGSSICDTFFVVYTEWGDPEDGAYKSDSGFEEWKVKKYPFVDVEKTATTTFTRTFDWTIEKSVTPATWDLFTGDSGTSRYTVALTKGAGVDSDWAVSGTITIENTSDQDAVITGVTDEITGVGAVSVACGVTFPYELPEGDTLVCSYSSALPDGSNRTNTAEATLEDGPVFSDDADITFGSPTTLVNDTVNVTDTFAGSLGAFSASGSTSYNRTFTCDADEGTHGNTATITETGQSDSASVTVNCYEVTVSKDAATTFTRTYDWSIDKSADQTEITLAAGQSFDIHYTVTVDMTGFTDSDWAVAGSITVHNPAPIAATINGVSDVVSPAIAASVDCGVTFPYSLAAGGDLVCTYDADLPDATSRTNTATATRQNYDYDYQLNATADGTTDVSGNANVTFSSDPSEEVDECVDVTDTYAGALGTVCVGDTLPATFNYTRTVSFSSAECGDHTVDNTATITTNDTATTADDDWSVLVHVLCPFGCTPGFWQGGVGEDLWDTFHDPDWTAAGGLGFNPFVTTDVFTSFFTPTGNATVDGMTMLGIVGSGGGTSWEQKAARDLIAAYLNASFGFGYPYSTATILADWATAVSSGDFAAFHTKYAAANELGCPL